MISDICHGHSRMAAPEMPMITQLVSGRTGTKSSPERLSGLHAAVFRHHFSLQVF